ncbi:MAG: TrmB family transcriptional regulator [Candidatus Eisenbacteria bacterium]|uniref:TrmB family transcriptional regulator n=1 Tax=Eiseniibacteriota bacterium TaxID=2212470 RepID=A0A7Y2EB99_UNCEI|nr:TrmB family transcriptional regulator [Candidatus Eisenbacteria bacterium]
MTTTELEEPLEALQDLGFSEIEALVYTYLLQNEASTGYRVSHAIGKPTANTYKAIASLQDQGAVLVDEGENRVVRAVPPKELLSQMSRDFQDRTKSAAEALAELNLEVVDDRVYALKSAGQVLERARVMLGRAKGMVLADIFPEILEELKGDFIKAAARGCLVTVKVYDPTELTGCECILQPDGRRVFSRWPGQQLSLVIDAEEHLLALFDDGLKDVHQAVWSRSTFLSCLHHNHLAMEHLVTLYSARRQESMEGADAAFQEHLNLSVLASSPSGLQTLKSRYGR